jgi:hypothetical protein
MQLIYTTGERDGKSFAVTTKHTSLPAGAVVYVICDGASVVERFDEFTYRAMSNLEYLKFRQMVDDAWRLELKQIRKAAPEGIFERFLGWISGQTAPVYTQNVRAY